MCAACSYRTSVTAGTIFDRTRTPLTVWFTACWLFATAKDGISALSLQRSPGDRLLPRRRGRCSPAAVGDWCARAGTGWPAGWRWMRRCHRAGRSRGCAAAGPGARSRPDRDRRGGQAADRDRPVPDGMLPRASAALRPRPARRAGATVITDAWMGYHGWPGSVCPSRRSQRAPAPRRSTRASCCPRCTGSPPGQAVAASTIRPVEDRTCRATWTSRIPLQPAPLGSRGLVFYRCSARRRPRPGAYRNTSPGKRPRKIAGAASSAGSTKPGAVPGRAPGGRCTWATPVKWRPLKIFIPNGRGFAPKP